jgi:hypothetical protein
MNSKRIGYYTLNAYMQSAPPFMLNQQSMADPATAAATGTREREIKRVKNGRIHLTPG